MSSFSSQNKLFSFSILSSNISKNKLIHISILLQDCLIHKISHHHLISKSFTASSNPAQR
ncbi:MAG: hypothetical protein LBQ24_06485 [Candidatus Peribacteria bacterium]|nr:hypothetical protein [Candidatus Peribacteria bacterium]